MTALLPEARILAMARTLAEKANECCYRSDGYEEDMAKAIAEAIRIAVAETAEACALVCDSIARDATKPLERAAAEIRRRAWESHG